METNTYLRDAKPYGATVRRGPSYDAISTQRPGCGERFPVIGR
jgi:hypothetical protein